MEITPGGWVGMRWCDQAGIDLTGSRERSVAAADAGEDGGDSDGVK